MGRLKQLSRKQCKERVRDLDLCLNVDFNTCAFGKVLKPFVPLVPNLSSVTAERRPMRPVQDNMCKEPVM